MPVMLLLLGHLWLLSDCPILIIGCLLAEHIQARMLMHTGTRRTYINLTAIAEHVRCTACLACLKWLRFHKRIFCMVRERRLA